MNAFFGVQVGFYYTKYSILLMKLLMQRVTDKTLVTNKALLERGNNATLLRIC
jgi:hypothetical protein